MSKELVKVDFSRGKWNPSDWMTFKSLRWEYTGEFEQEDDHIVNTPERQSEIILRKRGLPQ